MKTIQSPDGVKLLLENFWLRHKAGMKQRPCNVYTVELPPPTEEDLAEARKKRRGMHGRMMNLKNFMAHGFRAD